MERNAYPTKVPSARRGSSMVELLVVTVILLVIFGAIGLAVSSGSSAYEQGVAVSEVEAQARRMVERIASEVIRADRSSLTFTPALPPPGFPSSGARQVDYEQGEGFVAGALATGPRRRIQLVYSPGEFNDGIDNDGNGLIDECRVELVPDLVGAPGEIVGWGSFVREFLEGEQPNLLDDNGNGLIDERGLCLTYDNQTNTLTIRLTIERPGWQGQIITRTVETAVLVRND